jgi:hypothetical protein
MGSEKRARFPLVRSLHECDLWAAPINVRSWESNGLSADVTFGPFMTRTGQVGSKSRSAAVSTEMCYPFGRKHGRHRAVKRRAFISLLGGAAAWPLAARAQQAERVRRIGVLLAAAADDSEFQTRLGAFLQELQQLGWAIGRNVRMPDIILRRSFCLNLIRPSPIRQQYTTYSLAALSKSQHISFR